MTSNPLPILPLPEATPTALDAGDTTAPNAPFLKRPLSLRMTTLFLLLLTALAAFLRYWRIDHQAYWTDEGYTIERIRGTWDQLLHSLDKQGFPPGWYAMLRQWCLWVEQFTHNSVLAFSPLSTRGLTALFGTLTVPAIYYLARFFTDRKGALLVTLLAAVNPFLIYYSRDIKMYAPFWFFVVLNMALFLNFLKARWYVNLPWYLLFILTGACMTALHPMAWFIPPIQLIFLLTRAKPRPFDVPLWLLGVGTMCLFPYFWYFQFQPTVNQWLDRITTDKNMGMGWLARYTDMSWKTIGGMVTEHLGGFLWPVNPPDQRISQWFSLDSDFANHLATRDSDLIARWELYVAWTLLSILAMGLIPWRRFGKKKLAAVTSSPPPFHSRWWWIALWIAIPTITLALTWIPNKTEVDQKIREAQSERLRLSADMDQLRQTRDQLPDSSPVRRSVDRQLATRETTVKKIDDDIQSWRESMNNSWSEWVWHKFNPKPIWEPRYLGIIVPALLLWLAASLRRLPTLPLRVAAILFVVGESVVSASSNYLIYRNAPVNQVARIVQRFSDPANPNATAYAIPEATYIQPAMDAEFAIARNLRPGSPQERSNPGYSDSSIHRHQLEDDSDIPSWLQSTAAKPAVKTIVLTDRQGDLTDDSDPFSTKTLEKILGPSWKLVHEEFYQWHYEWRFYIFHTWRTRVWQRADR